MRDAFLSILQTAAISREQAAPKAIAENTGAAPRGAIHERNRDPLVCDAELHA